MVDSRKRCAHPGQVVSFSSEGLTAFLNDDTDGVVTLVVTGQTATGRLARFASVEDTYYMPPTLHVCERGSFCVRVVECLL